MFNEKRFKKIAPRVAVLILLGGLFLIPNSSPWADGGGSTGPFPLDDSTHLDGDSTGDTLPEFRA